MFRNQQLIETLQQSALTISHLIQFLFTLQL